MPQDLVERIELVEKAGELHLKGYNNMDIARELGIKRTEANDLLHDWKQLLRHQTESSSDIKNKVMDILFESEQHYETVRRRAWETVEQADEAGAINAKTNALKLVSTITKDIVGMFNEAGISQDSELIEELNERERNEQVLIELLKELREEFPQIADLISTRLKKIGEDVQPPEISVESVHRE